MQRIKNSFALVKQSWNVLQADKELVLLPVVSGIAAMITAATFIVPLFATEAAVGGAGSYIVMFLMYVALAYVTIFFNAALIHAANERMSGGNPTLGSALAGAASRAGKILPWAIVSATVSVVLRAIEERAGFVGSLLAGLAGVAWTVVTFLVLPIIVMEGVGVGDAIKKSSALFRQTWGENVAAQIGFSIVGVLAMIPGIALIVIGAVIGTGPALASGVIIGVLWMVLVGVVMASLSGIFQTALYHYATTGTVPHGGFSEATLASAFGPKRGKRISGFGG